MLPASPSIIAALSAPTVCTLKQIIHEYDLVSAPVLKACEEINAILVGFGIASDPPIGVLGLDDDRILKKNLSDEVIRQKIKSLIEGGENPRTEFKSTIFISTNKRAANPEATIEECFDEKLRDKAAREIAALLNSGGGNIIFGVKDDGTLYGCDEDFSIFEQGGSPGDKADLIFKKIADQKFLDGVVVFRHLQINCVQMDGKHVVMISVAPRQRLSFLKENQPSPLFIRVGTHAIPVPFHQIEDFFTLARS